MIAQFDASLAQFVQSWPSWLYSTMYTLSFIGRPIFTLVTLGVIALYALYVHQFRLLTAAGVAGATFGVNSLLKLLIHRARPDAYQAEDVMLPTYSFPSGHAASTVVIYGLVAYLAWKLLPQPWAGIVAGLLILIIVGIGISRIYIGAHYPSDVVAGWLVGLIGLACIIWIVKPL